MEWWMNVFWVGNILFPLYLVVYYNNLPSEYFEKFQTISEQNNYVIRIDSTVGQRNYFTIFFRSHIYLFQALKN